MVNSLKIKEVFSNRGGRALAWHWEGQSSPDCYSLVKVAMETIPLTLPFWIEYKSFYGFGSLPGTLILQSVP